LGCALSCHQLRSPNDKDKLPGPPAKTFMPRETRMAAPVSFIRLLCPARPRNELAPIIWMRRTQPESINTGDTVKAFNDDIGCNCQRACTKESLDNRRTVPRIIRRLHLLAQCGCRLPRFEIASEIEKSPGCHLGWIVERSVGGDFLRSESRDTNTTVPRVAVQGKHRQRLGAELRRKLAQCPSDGGSKPRRPIAWDRVVQQRFSKGITTRSLGAAAGETFNPEKP